ncbi:carbohydrate ABC transporter permease [Halarcobacter sp.]|uniref:carbohydrate ABC transporter permease n=1 Tax=Halarcobacter sp. TaxID=2321133 RepID=UPI002AAC2C1E|nr:carbohydrate ABC transporter permease [Halarcobacter sp.]
MISFRNKLNSVLFWFLIIITISFFLLPILWMFVTAFKLPADYISETPNFFPTVWSMEHITNIVKAGFFEKFLNTAIVSVSATFISLILAFMAAYALVRYRFPAKLDLLFLILVLIVKLMPPIVVALPLYELLKTIGLLNTLAGLVLTYQIYTLPFAIWMLLGFVRDVPKEIEEAAILDKTNLMQRLILIVLPLCGAGIAATAIFTMILCWNEFLFALLYLQQPDNFTLPLYIANFITENETFWGDLMGIGLLSSIPVLIIAVFAQKYLLRGFSMGVK